MRLRLAEPTRLTEIKFPLLADIMWTVKRKLECGEKAKSEYSLSVFTRIKRFSDFISFLHRTLLWNFTCLNCGSYLSQITTVMQENNNSLTFVILTDLKEVATKCFSWISLFRFFINLDEPMYFTHVGRVKLWLELN